MASWSPPRFKYLKQPDGQLLAVDDSGKPLTCQPGLTVQTIGGTETVVDPWGNTISEYQLPPYTIHIDSQGALGPQVGIAVDANGVPIPLVPPMTVVSTIPQSGQVTVKLPDGTQTNLPGYPGPDEYYIHATPSHTHAAGGVPEYELVAVDANGTPLPVQPTMGADPNNLWAGWAAEVEYNIPAYQFPEFSVHLQYDAAAYSGAAAPKPVPIAMGADGKPLATQPTFEIDPTDPSKVVAVLPDGQKYDPPAYQFPEFQVQLQYPAASYAAAAAPVPTPIAVDENGVPLPVQPHLQVDPNDHNQVTATLPDWTTTRVEVLEPPKDFFVHVEASGPPSAQGPQQFAAIAVDASGTPLPIQPHLVVDPTDPTKVTAMFPDGTITNPPNLYPPAGEPPTDWPPPAEEPPGDETPEGEANAEEGLEEEGFAAAEDYAGVDMSEGPVAEDTDWDEPDSTESQPDDLLTAGLDTAAGAAAAETAADAARTRVEETGTTELGEPVELITEGLAVESAETAASQVSDPTRKMDQMMEETGDPAYKFYEPGEEGEDPAYKFYPPGEEGEDPSFKFFEPVTEETEPGIDRIEEQAGDAPSAGGPAVEVAEPIGKDPAYQPSPVEIEVEEIEPSGGDALGLIEIQELETAETLLDGSLVADKWGTEDSNALDVEPQPLTDPPSAMEAIPPQPPRPVTEAPIETVELTAEPIEATTLEALPDLTDPLGEGRGFEEYEETELEIPTDPYEQSVPEEEEPEEEEQQT